MHKLGVVGIVCGHNGTSLLLAPLAAFAGFRHDGDEDDGDDDDIYYDEVSVSVFVCHEK